MFDLLIKNGQAADPATGFFAEADVAVEDERIALVEPGSAAAAHETIDAAGLIVQPGVIDTHLHVSTQPMGLRMAAMSGVTTCIDMMGPASAVMNHICEAGAGINVAVLSALVPNVNLPNSDPSAAQIDSAVTTALAEGAFGVKLLGGHFPLSPDATAESVRTASRRGVYLAWHAGTTTAGSDIEGMKQAIELADGLPSIWRTSMPTAEAAGATCSKSASRRRTSSRRILKSSPKAICPIEAARRSALTQWAAPSPRWCPRSSSTSGSSLRRTASPRRSLPDA